MAFAITQSCCSDAGCVSVCPVNCIHPTPDEPGFGTADILHIDPEACIDCGACADACPVDAIFPVDRLGTRDAYFAQVNADYYRENPRPAHTPNTVYTQLRRLPDGINVAIVGTGPSAGYTLRALINNTSASITIIDKLPTPGGLIRSGVAPDHPATKHIMDGFDIHLRDPRVTVLGGIEVGVDVSPVDLAEHFDAVVYAIGASQPRQLGIDGESTPGSTSATETVAWYNGIPDAHNPLQPARTGRSVLVGTGNVALDIARLMHTARDDLRRTDIADRSLPFFDTNVFSEVVLLGRRGPESAAYTPAEFSALAAMDGVDIVTVDASELDAEFFSAPVDPTRKRVVFAFNTTPIAIVGTERVDAIRVRTAGIEYDIPTDNVISSIGYRTQEVAGLPFDAAAGRIPNTGGRITAGGSALPGSYVVGWAKRGPSGGIGANRACADETVQALVNDIADGHYTHATRDAAKLAGFLRSHGAAPIRHRGIRAIDRAERSHGDRSGRPRVKITSATDLRQAASRRLRRGQP